MNLNRYLTIYGVLWRTSVTREMSFKGNFLLWIIVELAWFGLQLAFVGVIFSQTTTVGTWTVWQVVLLTGTSSFIQQIYQAFFLVNCTNLSELVRTGKMDFLLLLPVNTRFLVSLRQVDIPSFANAAFAVCVMTYAAGKLHLHPTAAQFLGFGALCAVGLLVHYSLMFMLASVSFWTVRAQGIVWGYYSLFNIARMPDEAFRGAVQGRVHFRAARAAGVQRARARAGGQIDFARYLVGADRPGCCLGAHFRMVLAFLHSPLHQREHVRKKLRVEG